MEKHLNFTLLLLNFLHNVLQGQHVSERKAVTRTPIFSDPLSKVQGVYRARLWGGNATTIEQHPYTVAVTDTDAKHGVCTGVIIGIKWILTAGNCFKKEMTVYAGGNAAGEGTSYNVKKWYKHPRFTQNENKTHYDYMLLELEGNLHYFNKIKSIKLGKQEDIVGNQHLILTGYGQRNKLRNDEDLLLFEMNMSIMSDVICTNMYPVTSLREGEFCASDFGEGKAPCPGDLGAPAVFNNTLLGFAVRGYGCGKMTDGLFILASVPFVKDWILDIILQ